MVLTRDSSPKFRDVNCLKIPDPALRFGVSADMAQVVAALSAEYEACERPDYIERASGGPAAATGPPTAAADTRIPQAV